ncbi:MAG TPA: hypothetical protein VG838_14375 [Opitutaceae bacterium]|nr:hypothetical protein [Opitutaceae bacterium]
MKNSKRLVLLPLVITAAALLSACQSASLTQTDSFSFAATPAVLQASPDILGGLIGREAVGAFNASHSADRSAQRAELDQRAYLIWKHSQNS